MPVAVIQSSAPPVSRPNASGAPKPPYPTGDPIAALGFFALSASALVVGMVGDFGAVWFPAAGLAGLTAYAFAAKWVARLPRRNAVTRFLGRVRRAMAYEG